MFFKIAILCVLAAVASAVSPGYISSAYSLGSQAEHTIRGYGGLSSVSKHAKAVDSPYSTVRKTDIRYTNDAYSAHPAVSPVAYAHHGHAYGAPALAHHGYAAPAIAHGYHTAPPSIAHGYPAPAGAITYAHHGYGVPAAVAHHSPIGYAHRGALAAAVPAKGVAVPHGLGVAFSPATAVATSTFSGYGVHYGY